MAFDVPKQPPRDYYLVWKEGKAPDVVVEITSKSTKQEDRKKNSDLSRYLRVPEYFLFDPTEDYLAPHSRAFGCWGGYIPIEPTAGRLPSQVLGLDLERDGEKLRLFDPATGRRLLTPSRGARQPSAEPTPTARAEDERRRAEEAEATRQRLSEENNASAGNSRL